ncbi:hypothetical protein FDECE_4812 [Fusarium decemcellulare]|nr:hypothetical protein FDECE_4812 [Fusarium decemcellulare]
MSSPFFVPVSLSRTALILSDVQTQILARFPKEVQDDYLAKVQELLEFFRSEITSRRSKRKPVDSPDLYDDVPMIIHHTLPFNINSNAFVSPYNKLASWVSMLEQKGFFAKTSPDPRYPDYSVPDSVAPPAGWGGKDEILLGKLQPNCFGSSDLLAYLRARGIRHVMLIGLTTMGSILGSARAGADLDFHISLVEECIMDDDKEVHELLMKRILPKFVDLVTMQDVLALASIHK